MANTIKNQINGNPRRYIYTATFGLVVFSLSALVATNNTLSVGEQQLFHLFFGLPIALIPLLLLVTQFGSAWMVGTVVLLAFLRRQKELGLKLFLAGVTTYILVELAKELIHRPRPAVLLPEILHREIFVCGFGFPSGHTAMATVMSLTLLPYLPKKYRFVVPLWIGGVGVSRIYLGVHAPLDILGGFALGLFIASLFHFFLTSAGREPHHIVKSINNKT